MTGGARSARPRRTSRLAEARAAAARPRRRGAGGRSPARGRRRERCRRPRRESGTRGSARFRNGGSGERVVGDDGGWIYRGGPFGVGDASEMATRRGVGSVFRPVRKAGINNPDSRNRGKNIGNGDVIARTSTLVAEEPATRRPGTCVVTRVRVLSAGSVDRSTRLIGVKGSGRTEGRSRATFRDDARKVSVALGGWVCDWCVYLVHPFCKISTPEIPGLIAFDQNRPVHQISVHVADKASCGCFGVGATDASLPARGARFCAPLGRA